MFKIVTSFVMVTSLEYSVAPRTVPSSSGFFA
jgi:hypothetical protein